MLTKGGIGVARKLLVPTQHASPWFLSCASPRQGDRKRNTKTGTPLPNDASRLNPSDGHGQMSSWPLSAEQAREHKVSPPAVPFHICFLNFVIRNPFFP